MSEEVCVPGRLNRFLLRSPSYVPIYVTPVLLDSSTVA